MITLTQTYPTDLTSAEGEQVVDFFAVSRRGRPRKWAMWQILNALLDVTRTGCQWRRLPRDFPPWQTVYGYCWRGPRSGLWERLKAGRVKQARQQAGRTPQPRAALIDSPRVKTSEGGAARGVEVSKQTNGRKRHSVVEVLGLWLVVGVHSAGIPEGTGGKLTLPRLCDRSKRSVPKRYCRRKRIWAAGA